MLHLVLADSELETVPPEISSEGGIRRSAERRGKEPTELILDSNYHHGPMKRLEDSDRRGRPDIVHVCLLTALDSPLNREGHLRLYVHTRHEGVIDVDPHTRIPRSYNRFVGLIEQLFLTGGVPPEDPLLRLRDSTLSDLLKTIRPRRTLTLAREGVNIDLEGLFGEFRLEEDICVIVGGFPHGDFKSDVEGLSDGVVSIYEGSLDAVTAVTHAIQFYEESHGII